MITTKVTVVGAGYWGKNLIRNFHQLGALGAVCDSSEASLAFCKKEYPDVRLYRSFDDVLANKNLGAIVLATPAETHAELVRKALESGKDVFVEKPLSLDMASAEHLVNLAEQKKKILMVGHLLWYHPAILKLKQMIQQGELGRLQYIYSNRLNLGRFRQEENILWSFAPHDISVILGLVGDKEDSIVAQGGNYLHPQLADVTVSCISFRNGVRAHVFVSWLHPFKEQKLVVVGDKKMAVFDDLQTDQKLVVYPHTITWQDQIPIASRAQAEVIPLEKVEPLRAECQHFLECLESRRPPRTDGYEGLRVLAVLDACQKALESSAPSKRVVWRKEKKPYFAHESASVDENVVIGEGTSIWHVSHVLKESSLGKNCRIGQNVVIGPRVQIGDNVKIQNNVSVYEGVTLESDVFCGPSMVFTNVVNPRSEVPRMEELKRTLVKRGATLGANCTILCGVTLGRYAFVGAGAVVTHDVPDFTLVVGNPARPVGWMCQCGVKLQFKGNKSTCPACDQKYEKKKGRVVLVSKSRP